MEATRQKIHFDFRLTTGAGRLGAVEKDEGGAKRRYLEGVASGIQVDGHGERMTEACIASFQRQAQSGDILLYEGLHGVNFVDDVGKLVASTINGEGEWVCSFRLYDEQDGFDPSSATLEKATKLWLQVNGLPPYSAPRPKGFSIEGEVPDGGIISADSTGRRVMNDVTLLGVVVVDKPAYGASVAHAVYKALGVVPPWRVRKGLEKGLQDKVGAAAGKASHFRTMYQLQDALDEGIRQIMQEDPAERQDGLNDLFAQFSKLAIEQVLAHPDSYSPAPVAPEGNATSQDSVQKDGGEGSQRLLKLRALLAKLQILAGQWRELQGGENGKSKQGLERQS